MVAESVAPRVAGEAGKIAFFMHSEDADASADRAMPLRRRRVPNRRRPWPDLQLPLLALPPVAWRAAFRTRASIQASQFRWVKGVELLKTYHSSEFTAKRTSAASAVRTSSVPTTTTRLASHSTGRSGSGAHEQARRPFFCRIQGALVRNHRRSSSVRNLCRFKSQCAQDERRSMTFRGASVCRIRNSEHLAAAGAADDVVPRSPGRQSESDPAPKRIRRRRS